MKIKNTHRDYRKEEPYEDSPEQVKRRESRNKARRQMIKLGKARKGDGLDLAHKNGNPLDDKVSNYKMESKHKNRAYPRDKHAHKVNPRS